LVVELAAIDETLTAYGIAGNKGYSSAGHLAALKEFGPHRLHRQTWLHKILADDELF
jgi:ribonuclease HII